MNSVPYTSYSVLFGLGYNEAEKAQKEEFGRRVLDVCLGDQE
jgi:hypothetical protein